MLEALRESQRLQHEFVAFGMNPAVCDVFKITHVARIFHVAGSEEQVLGAANPETSRRAEIS
jgi:anti-anti-sigma regulatory factor